MPTVIFASAISSSADAMAGVDKLVSVVTGRVSPSRGDLLLYFATPHFEDDLDDIIPKLTDAYPDATLIGCTAEGTIGANREVERAPSMSLLVASMPGVEIRSFTLTQGQLQTATRSASTSRALWTASTRRFPRLFFSAVLPARPRRLVRTG